MSRDETSAFVWEAFEVDEEEDASGWDFEGGGDPNEARYERESRRDGLAFRIERMKS